MNNMNERANTIKYQGMEKERISNRKMWYRLVCRRIRKSMVHRGGEFTSDELFDSCEQYGTKR